MFGLGTLLEACLLFVNAVAVLHEERFLKKYGLSWDHELTVLNFTLCLLSFMTRLIMILL